MSRKNIKRIALVLSVIIAIYLIRSCVGDPPPPPLKKTLKDNLNITLFLDLSDHLDHTMPSGNGKPFGMTRCDNFIRFSEIFGKKYISTIQASKRPERTFDDKIHLRTHPVASFPFVHNYLTDFVINKESISRYVLHDTLEISSTLKNNVASIFDDCGKKYNGKKYPNDYPGSDIYSFFKQKDFYISDNKNVLIIYTDGYPYHQDNKGHDTEYFTAISPGWKQSLHGLDENELWSLYGQDSTIGLKPATSNLNNLRVLIVGGETKGDNGKAYEKDLMNFLWTSWMQKMGVKRHNVKLLFMDECIGAKLEKEYHWLLTAPW